jgi:hypothetical protein
MLKTVFKANIDIVHIQLDEASTLVRPTARAMNTESTEDDGPLETQSVAPFQVSHLAC